MSTAPFEADDARVETVARALWEADNDLNPVADRGFLWALMESHGIADRYRRLAAAAIAALPPSPAEEAAHEVDCPSCGATIRARMADADPTPAEQAVRAAPADEMLLNTAMEWIWRHTSQPDGDRWLSPRPTLTAGDDPNHLPWAAENLLCDLAPWLNQAGRDEVEWQRAGDWHAGYEAGRGRAWGFIARLRAALASPAPAPMCRCGHFQHVHGQDDTACLVWRETDQGRLYCPCPSFDRPDSDKTSSPLADEHARTAQ